MIVTAPHPSRLLRIAAGAARWSLALLLAFWLLVIVAGVALHGVIVPRIGEFRAQIEARATRALGTAVQIGALSARSQGLVPSIELREVTLLDSAGRPALRLPRVLLALSARSLLRGGVEQLYLEAPALQAQRMADGRVFVAGLELAGRGGQGSAAADWLLAQPEVVIKNGSLRWSDALRPAAAPLALSAVDLVLRNGNWRHRVRLDATPPPDWGARFQLVGLLRQPLLRAASSGWQHWSGQLYADFARADLARIAAQLDLAALLGAPQAISVAHGRGALRAWADLHDGQISGAVADLALTDLQARIAPDLPPLLLAQISGRLSAQRSARGFAFATQALRLRTGGAQARDAHIWPAGAELRIEHSAASGLLPEHGQLHADRLDLALLAHLAARLPLPAALQRQLADYAPQGQVDDLAASWSGPLIAPQKYRVRAAVRDLALAAQGAAATHLGIRGANLELDMNQSGGQALLAIAGGALLLPGVFEDPVLPLQRLRADLRWTVSGAHIRVSTEDLQFANADAQGQARLVWHTGGAGPHRVTPGRAGPAAAAGGARFPGVLDLSGQLTRADGTRVHRYLPLSIPAETRHYVRDAISAGSAHAVQFRVRGDLQQLPFNDPGAGEFRIAAQLRGVRYGYVPQALQPAGSLPWPALTELAGELVFERSSMRLRAASSAVAGARGLQFTQIDARIPDLAHSVVAVNAQARGPLAQMLAVVATSPLARMTGNALDQASASGNAELQLRLQLPIAEIAQSKVEGSLTLAGAGLRINPETPALAQLRGALQFSESGFTLANVQAQALGGALRIDGALRAAASGPESTLQLRAQGAASAEALQQSAPAGWLAQLARHASGATAYTLALTQRRGVAQWQISSNLQGLALALPAPLGKAADARLPLRFETRLLSQSPPGSADSASAPLREQITLELGAIGSASWLRERSGAQTRVLRGAIALGLDPDAGATAPIPEHGVAAHIRQEQLDLDAWARLLAHSPAAAQGAGSAQGAAAAEQLAYLPTRIALRARTLKIKGRRLHDLVAGAQREGGVWQASVAARELDGYLEYRQGAEPGDPGRLFARLAHLRLPAGAADAPPARPDGGGDGGGADGNDADGGGDDDGAPDELPALDITAEQFELRGKPLGRLTVQAQNRGAPGQPGQWRLDKFDISAPEASLSATGSWAAPAGSAQRRSALDFTLAIHDSGALLARFGMPDLLRAGTGRVQGQLAWAGAPLNPAWRSMSGQLNLDMAQGQFLKADPGIAKLLGVLSLQSLPRRLALDFRDVFSEGFAFDFVRGDLRVQHGLASTNNLQMKGVQAAVLMEGSADIAHETQDLHVLVVPELNAMTASLVATAINPVLGLGSFLAQVFLRGPLIEAATREFHISGHWADPQVQRIQRTARAARATDAGTANTAPAEP